MFTMPAVRHEGAGPRSVSLIVCRRDSVNLSLTWTRPFMRVVLARQAPDPTGAGLPAGALATLCPDGDAAPELEPVADELLGAIAGGADGTFRSETGRSGVGTGTTGARTAGLGSVGARMVGTGTIGPGKFGAATVGTGGGLGVVTTTVVTGVGTLAVIGVVGTTLDGGSSGIPVAPIACATARPKAGRTIAAKAVRPRIIPNMCSRTRETAAGSGRILPAQARNEGAAGEW